MPIPKAVARFNRYVTNPIARRVAGWAPMFAILYHQGRRSGKRYSTPINIFRADGGFVIALTYGPDVEWVKNIGETQEAEIRYRSRQIRVVRPQRISTSEGMAAMPRLVRLILRMINVTEFLHLSLWHVDQDVP